MERVTMDSVALTALWRQILTSETGLQGSGMRMMPSCSRNLIILHLNNLVINAFFW